MSAAALVVTAAGKPVMAGTNRDKVWAEVGKIMVNKTFGRDVIDVHEVDWVE